jgi:hypothetical protein
MTDVLAAPVALMVTVRAPLLALPAEVTVKVEVADVPPPATLSVGGEKLVVNPLVDTVAESATDLAAQVASSLLVYVTV